jgi:hypothetical protein
LIFISLDEGFRAHSQEWLCHDRGKPFGAQGKQEWLCHALW